MKVNSRYVDFRGVNHKLVGGSVDLRILSSEGEEILSSSKLLSASVSHVSTQGGGEEGAWLRDVSPQRFVADSLLFCTAVSAAAHLSLSKQAPAVTILQ